MPCAPWRRHGTAEDAESGDVDIPGSISVNGIQYAVTTVNLEGFSQCNPLHIPSPVTQINAGAAQDQKLTWVTVDANNCSYMSEEGVVLSKTAPSSSTTPWVSCNPITRYPRVSQFSDPISSTGT